MAAAAAALLRPSLLPTTLLFRRPASPLRRPAAPLRRPFSTPTRLVPCASNQQATTPAADRLASAAAYFLPFFNGVQFGRFLFSRYPSLALAFEPLFPLMSLYRSLPYASFVAFFALYLGVVRNPAFSRYVRFNSMQALVLDVLLSVPLLLQRIFNPTSGLGLKMVVVGYDFIFVFIVTCFVYSVVSCVLGKTPHLPIVAAAAGRQL